MVGPVGTGVPGRRGDRGLKIPETALKLGLEAVRAGWEADLGMPVVILPEDDLAALRDGTPASTHQDTIDSTESEAA